MGVKVESDEERDLGVITHKSAKPPEASKTAKINSEQR